MYRLYTTAVFVFSSHLFWRHPLPIKARRATLQCIKRTIHLFSVFFCSTSRTNRGHTGGGNTAVQKKWGSRGGSKKRGEVGSFCLGPSVFRTLIWYSDFLERGRGRSYMQGQYGKAQKHAIKTSVSCTLSSAHRKQKSCPRTKYAYLLI